MARVVSLAASCLLILCGAGLSAAEAPSPQDVEFFEKKIRPIFAKHCYECHSAEADEPAGNLLLDRKAGWMQGGDLGAAIVPGNPEESLLIGAVRYTESDLEMPPVGKLSDAEIKLLEEWVRRGAPDPRTGDKLAAERTSIDLEAGREHWAFQPPVDPPLPAVKDGAWAQSPIDHFILAALEAKGLSPTPPADKRTLLRRATFDLTGLPPTPDEMAAFLADDSPDAFARVVDRLLASPHYGERWGRHWLDVARYADSNGLDENVAHGNAWRYRDWVVSAFNRDLPYFDFLVWQLAGDLLPTEDEALRRERLVATGFLSMGPKVLAEPDKEKMQMDIVDEQIDTVGKTFLGLTLGCARCHDHKFDPIPTTDYYALAGVFKSTETMESYKTIARWYEHPLPTSEELKRQTQHEEAVAAKKSEIDQTVKAANEQLVAMLGADAEIPKDAEAKYPEETKAKLKTLREELAALEKNPPEVTTVMGVHDGEVADTAVHIRGNHTTLGDVVPRRFPQVLSPDGMSPFPADQSGRRMLAEWMASPEHPLTARVFVNRIWRWRFGEGLVATTDNFGLLGEKPSHPELLDWLTHRFLESGGSLKAMHRLTVLSSTYRMSSDYNQEAAQADPVNRLLWRWTPRRLEAEAVRDSLLLVSGLLDRRVGGSRLHVKNREFLFNHTSKDETTYDYHCRSLYLPVIRNHVYDALELFDFPDPAVVNGDRASTTVAPQALLLMNSDIAWQSAQRLGETLLSREELSDRERADALYGIALSRPADEDEIDRALSFLAAYAANAAEEEQENTRLLAWQSLCQAVLASNEFIYVK